MFLDKHAHPAIDFFISCCVSFSALLRAIRIAVQIWELLTHFGHGDLPPSDLAGLLSECRYKGDQLKAILDKAAENRKDPNDLKNHKSLLVRKVAQTIAKRKGLRRVVPESTNGICCVSALTFILCAGFFASMGAPPAAPGSPRSQRLLPPLPRSFTFPQLCRPLGNHPAASRTRRFPAFSCVSLSLL